VGTLPDDVQLGPAAPVAADRRSHDATTLIAALAGLAGAWIAAGSTGLLGHPLRHALTCVAAGLMLIMLKPSCQDRRALLLQALAVTTAVIAAIFMVASPLPPVNVLAVAVILLAISCGQPAAKRTILAAAAAIVVLALYRLAYLSIPLVWLQADWLGGALGRAAGLLTGRPLWVGATMGGIDFLVVMLCLALSVPLWGGRRAGNESPRLRRTLLAVVLVLLGHLVYLALLAFTADLFNWLPQLRPGDMFKEEWPEATSLKWTLRDILPWNLPALAAVIHIVVAWVIFRRLANRQPESDRLVGATVVLSPRGGSATATPTTWPREAEGAEVERKSAPWVFAGLLGASVLLAAGLPVLTTLCWHRPSLQGKKVVFYKEGFLNWLRPTWDDYGQYSGGMYGMLPVFLESLGAKTLVSPHLSDEDLRDADALILLYPNKPWEPAEENKPWEGSQLDRIGEFVERGGTLLIAADHTTEEKDGRARFNDVLDEHTAMHIPFDSALFTVGGWLHSYDALAHPTSAGIEDDQNQFGVVIGASVKARWPARPLLVGRWGWADAGNRLSGEAKMGDRRYDPGEKLGDLVLAAEQPVGRGKIIAFGDTSSLTNGITVGCHEYTSRLMAYLVDGSCTPQTTYRQVLGLLVGLILLGLLVWRPDPWRVAAVAVALSASLIVCTKVTHNLWEVLPDGNACKVRPDGTVNKDAWNNLAYIDMSHANAFSREGWGDDGTMGLCLTLMRDGYLTLLLPEFSAERLKRAGLLVCIAPGREFTESEREVVKDFVSSGGILIYTVGYDSVGPSRALLDDFGFRIGQTAEEEEQGQQPEALGWCKAPYFRGPDYLADVRFHAAWRVYCEDADAPKDSIRVLAYDSDASNHPLIVTRRYGEGRIVVVGDTGFAMNKNLEQPSGAPIEGLRENAHFWRWLLPALRHSEPWYPPKPVLPSPVAAEGQQLVPSPVPGEGQGVRVAPEMSPNQEEAP